MAAMFLTAPRRTVGLAWMMPLLLCLCLVGRATGQGTAPLVIASAPAGLNHPTGWQVIQQTAITPNGDWLVEEFPDGGLFEFPANGGPMITLVPLTGLGSKNGYQNPLVLLDPASNLYLGGNWNNCLLMFPYNAATNSWPTLSSVTASNNSPSYCGTTPPTLAQYSIFGFSPYYFQPWGIAVGTKNNLIVGSQNSGNFIFSMNVQGAWNNPSVTANSSSTTEIISKMTQRPNSIAVDPEGNIYFVEDTKGLPGVYEIPAGTTGLTSDAGLTRVDPNLPSVTAVVTDAAGNLYISDSQAGVFVVPNPSGTPQTSAAYMLSSVPTVGEVAIDPARHVLYVPTNQAQVNNNEADVAKVGFAYAELGSSSVGVASNQGTTGLQVVSFAFNGSVTPASFVIVQAGKTTPDFSFNSYLQGITGCTAGTAYAANTYCTQTIAFTPSSVGSISAKLLMLDAKNNVLASIMLHGTGTGANVQVSPGLESTIGSGLKAPGQVATDAIGNVYVADSSQGKVFMFAAGSGTSGTGTPIGSGFTSPTGVAVDGAGDVFVADSGTGTVYEVPFGPSGLNAAGQVTLAGGLGNNLNLAVDGLGDVYIADPSNTRVVKVSNPGGVGPVGTQLQTILKTGFTAPSAVAVDASSNLYVIDGTNLFELTGGTGAPTTLLNNLSGATSLAVDPSGAVYISTTGTTERIPLVGGVLAPGSATAVAANVNNASSVALDQAGNIYVTAAAGGGVTLLGTNGTLNFGNVPLGNQPTLTSTITNSGNAPLSITGYTTSNSIDYTAADGTCMANSPIAPGGTCAVNVTLAPGPGEQGTLTAQIGVKTNASNGPITIGATGVGAPLANSATSSTVAAGGEVINTSITIGVAPKSGTGTAPTGLVTVTYKSFNVIQVGGVPTINPFTATASGNLVNGSVQFNLTPVLAGAQTINVSYGGDRVYGRSTTSSAVTIAKSQVRNLILDPNPPPFLPFVLESGSISGSIPYDGSVTYWQYKMPVKVDTAAGVPTGTLTFMDNSSACPTGTSATGQGAAICALENYSGVACPTSAGAATVTIANDGTTPTGATASFATGCLPMPQNTTYTPVISTHLVTPVYSGDANFVGVTGAQGTLFQALRSPEVLITSSPSSLNVPHGSSASATLTISSLLGYGYGGKGAQLNDYNFPVTLSCDNLPPHSACSFNYPTTVNAAQPSAANSVQIPCTGTTQAADNCSTGTVQVTVSTNVTVGTTTSRYDTATSITLASLFGIGMVGLFVRRRAFGKSQLLFVILIVLAGSALITACNTTNLSPNAVTSTPSGTYPVTITAQQVGYQCIPLAGPGANCTTTGGGPGIAIYGSQNQVSVPFYLSVAVQ